jgi:hypothetical protein
MIIYYHHRIYRKCAPPIVQNAIDWEPDMFQNARNQIVLGMIAMRDAVMRAEEILGEVSYVMNKWRMREDERRKQTQQE